MNKKTSILSFFTALLLTFVCFFTINENAKNFALAAFRTNGVKETGTYHLYPAFLATTTSATSTPINIAGAKKITVFFGRGDTNGQGNSGSTNFSIQVSGDDSTYITYAKLIDNVANTNAQNLTRVSSSTIAAATTTKTYSLDLSQDTFVGLKCIAAEATDGQHTCQVLVEYQ